MILHRLTCNPQETDNSSHCTSVEDYEKVKYHFVEVFIKSIFNDMSHHSIRRMTANEQRLLNCWGKLSNRLYLGKSFQYKYYVGDDNVEYLRIVADFDVATKIIAVLNAPSSHNQSSQLYKAPNQQARQFKLEKMFINLPFCLTAPLAPFNGTSRFFSSIDLLKRLLIRFAWVTSIYSSEVSKSTQAYVVLLHGMVPGFPFGFPFTRREQKLSTSAAAAASRGYGNAAVVKAVKIPSAFRR